MMQRLDAVFELRYGHSLALNKLTKVEAPQGVNFVSRAMRNNGVTGRVQPPEGEAVGAAGEITVALSGNGVLSAYVQPEPFLTGYHVMILTPKDAAMTTAEKLWWCRCILANRYRYSYGRQANRTLAALMLPGDLPEWVKEHAATDFLATDLKRFFPDSLKPSATPSGPRMVEVRKLFDVSYGQSLELNRLTKVRAPEGVNFISRTSRTNGVAARVLVPEGVEISAAGCITVALSGAPLVAFYQAEPFVTAYHVAVLTPKRVMSVGELLWWCHVIHANAYRYSYGRQANRTLATLKLPTKIPDYAAHVIEAARSDELFPAQRSAVG